MNQLLPIDKVTFWMFIGFWPIWIVWELVLLALRGQNPSVDLISMVARDRGYQMASLAFAWGSLAAHFWINWKERLWENPMIPGVIFWVLLAAVFCWDLFLWKVPYREMSWIVRVVRWPGTMLFLGLLNGAFLFPQKGKVGQPF